MRIFEPDEVIDRREVLHGRPWLVTPGPAWRWKDRDDVVELVRAGRLTPAEADDVWAETAKVATALDRGDRWWTDWDGWTPDPGWPVPGAGV